MDDRRWSFKSVVEFLTTIAVLIAAVMFVATQGRAWYTIWTGTGGDLDITGALTDPEQAAARGAEEAPVVLTVFADFQCPACNTFVTRTLPEIERRYVATGQVRIVYRHFRLERIHPNAYRAAVGGECARRQGRFWEMHDVLFENQRRLSDADLATHAAAVGLEASAFADCMAADADDVVKRDLDDARRLGLTATPSFLVSVASGNGQLEVIRAFSGSRSPSRFTAVLDGVLADERGRLNWTTFAVALVPGAAPVVWLVRRRRATEAIA